MNTLYIPIELKEYLSMSLLGYNAKTSQTRGKILLQVFYILTLRTLWQTVRDHLQYRSIC